ncbi:MAG: hypothetical protein WAW13_03505, partial [Minisyncoccia bacterium]
MQEEAIKDNNKRDADKEEREAREKLSQQIDELTKEIEELFGKKMKILEDIKKAKSALGNQRAEIDDIVA